MRTKDKILQVMMNYIKSGINLENVSMQTIANDVEIGKSTLYEYFDNKQQIITEAYVYLIRHYHEILVNVDKSKGFEYALKKEIQLIIEVMTEAKMIMEAILQNSVNIDITSIEIIDEIKVVSRSIEQQILSIFELGYQEKIISNQYFKKDAKYVIKALLGNLSLQYVSQETHFSETEIVDFIYQTILVYLK